MPTRGDLDVLVVRAGFPDRALSRPRSEFLGGPDALFDRLTAYWAEVSAGRLRVRPHLGTPDVTLPKPRARYVQRPGELASDAVTAFAAATTDAEDRALLAAAPAVVVVFAGTGRESHVERPQPDDPWSNYVQLAPPVEGFAHAVVLAESEEPPFSNFGVLCHEFGHLLGLPELYATGGRVHEGIGVWGLMGQGTWLGRGDQPPHPEAWSKLEMGWVDVETVDRSSAGVRLPAIAREPRVVKIPADPAVPEEYYLLENRQRVGFDAKLPGEGILVWHVDERVSGYRTSQNDPAHKRLHLVEADGRADLDRGHAAGGNRGDASDPWAGSPSHHVWRAALVALGSAVGVVALLARWRVPGRLLLAVVGVALVGAGMLAQDGPVCGPETPGMRPYGGGPGRVVLRNFSPNGPAMQVDVEIAPAQPPEAGPGGRPERPGVVPGAPRGS